MDTQSSSDTFTKAQEEVEMEDASVRFTKSSSSPRPSGLSLLNPMHWKPLLTRKLDSSHMATQTIFAVITAFSAYFTTYGIHTAIFAATFSGQKIGSLDLKVAFSISQTLSYAVSKIVGALVIPTIERKNRLMWLIALMVLGEIPLVIFGGVPPIAQVFMVFLSGLPTAWMWGIMVMYLEGRKTSEFLIMGLYLSVMVASGAAKSVAAATIQMGVSEGWMPAVVGAFSVVIFVVFIYGLDALPDPTTDDKKDRNERRTMSQKEARAFLLKWAPGFLLVTLIYSLLGAYRNFRDYFAPELWQELEGPNFNPAVFTNSELPVGICTAAAYSLLYWIKDNKKAFFAILGAMIGGGLIVLLATIAQTAGAIHNPLTWMILIGVGLFMAYIPPGAMLYDRFNGAIGQPYTSVFMIYLSDASGYICTLAILFYRNFGDAKISWVDFFQKLSFISSILCMAGIAVAAVYFFVAMRVNVLPPCVNVEDGYFEVREEPSKYNNTAVSVSVSDTAPSTDESGDVYMTEMKEKKEDSISLEATEADGAGSSDTAAVAP